MNSYFVGHSIKSINNHSLGSGNLYSTFQKAKKKFKKNKRPTGLNGHLSIKDFTPTSCQKGSYLYINNPIIE